MKLWRSGKSFQQIALLLDALLIAGMIIFAMREAPRTVSPCTVGLEVLSEKNAGKVAEMNLCPLGEVFMVAGKPVVGAGYVTHRRGRCQVQTGD